MSDAELVHRAIEATLATGHFFVAPPKDLRVEYVAEKSVPWEIFRGHLLDEAHTSQRRRFESWHVYLDGEAQPAGMPLVSVYWDVAAERVHVVRRILTYGFEAYEDTPGVILSRPVEKWTRELVGSAEIARLRVTAGSNELESLLLQAAIGTSRLPITSLESPLPAYSLGEFAYLPRYSLHRTQPWTDPIEVLQHALAGKSSSLETARGIELALRATPADRQKHIATEIATYVGTVPAGLQRVCHAFRSLFNMVALSPYTQFVDRLVATLWELAHCEQVGAAPAVDVLSYMLRHLCRHLTAFDLTTFHNFGANYPDALYLDALLKTYLRLIDENLELLLDSPRDDVGVRRAKRLRRRALRQACLVRKHYEGHAVPDAPTSQGENLRVLPAPFVRVPEEQIVQAGRRRRALFADDPLAGVLTATGREVLDLSLADLDAAAELPELGTASFLDRPLGIAKEPGEVDRTPLVSYVAVSRSMIGRRVGQLHAAGWIECDARDRLQAAVDTLPIAGVPIEELALVERPGVVSLADARKAASDFVVLRTSHHSLEEFAGHYELGPLERLWQELTSESKAPRGPVLVHCAHRDGTLGRPMLVLYDARGRPRAELGLPLGPDGAVGYVERGGVELVERLQLLRNWEAGEGELIERDLSDRDQWITRRDEDRAPGASGVPA